MKQLLLFLFGISIPFFMIGQTSNQNLSAYDYSDNGSDSIDDAVYYLIAATVADKIDSICNEGMYMTALECMDSIEIAWEKSIKRELPTYWFLKKGNILMRLEEWNSIVEMSELYIKTHNFIEENDMAILYNMTGIAYRNIEDFSSALKNYELALSIYKRKNDLGNVGGILCDIAYCYRKMGRSYLSSSFQEKGLSAYYDYFGVTKKRLLSRPFNTTNPHMKTVLNLFAANLFQMAILAQEDKDYDARYEFLKMAANCGDETALQEFKRIYGK